MCQILSPHDQLKLACPVGEIALSKVARSDVSHVTLEMDGPTVSFKKTVRRLVNSKPFTNMD